MRTIPAAILPTFLAMSLQAGLVDEASAASPERRGYTTHCYGTPEQCMRGDRAEIPTPRGYLPTQRYGREYDFPRFGSELWWEEEEDRD